MGMVVDPDTATLIEETTYLVQNDLPIPRASLYTIFPELFDYDADDFNYIKNLKEQKKRLKLKFVVLKD